MAQKIINLPDIGPVILAKRRGTKNIRLSVLADGRVRVGLPHWAPYAAGTDFARQRADWIRRHSAQRQPAPILRDGHRIGKTYNLKIMTLAAGPTTTRLSANSITVRTAIGHDHRAVQQAAARASERALKKEAQVILAPRLSNLAQAHGYSYRNLKIKKMKSRWGSCSSDGTITLNCYLVQLPWELIDYVLLHELVHTRHMDHSRDFWDEIKRVIPGTLELRRRIKDFSPALAPL